LKSKAYILATIHRAENTDNPVRLEAIFGGLMQVAQEIPVVLPLHPRTRKALERENLFAEVSASLQLIEPVGYLDMVMLEKNACLIATDSGGVQKESFFYRVPCVTLREETEWIELVDIGWNYVVSFNDKNMIFQFIQDLLKSASIEKCNIQLYGNGNAATLVSRLLIDQAATRK
jgi:UDP-GlcNAc3NAcA epimerase